MNREQLDTLLQFRGPSTCIAILELLIHISTDNKATVTQEALSNLVSLSRPTIQTSLKKLKAAGLISFDKWNRSGTGIQQCKEYTIL